MDWAPAGRERLRLGREAAKSCGDSAVPARVPGCHLMVTKAAGGLPPTSAGTSLILAQKHQGSHQENAADKLQPGGPGEEGIRVRGVGRRKGQSWESCGSSRSIPEPGVCLVPQFPHRGCSGLWVSAGTPLPPGEQIRAKWDDLILWEMSLKADQAADETPDCCGRERGDGGTATSVPAPPSQ